MIRLILLALLAAGFGCASPAPAARFERIVAFGDSYADDGNIYELFGSTPPARYPRGRFSNGTNFVDTMADLLHLPIANFALGGAVTGEGSNNSPAGLNQQIRAFLSGGGPAFYPRVSGKFSARDLVVLSIGGNDARAYEKSQGRTPSKAAIAAAVAGAPGAAAKSVANTEAALGELVRAGARHILFLGGDVGRLPEVRGSAIAPIGSAFSASYNSGIKAALSKVAAQHVQVDYVDLEALAQRVEANPSAYGLVSAGACPAACLSDPSMADKYLFYVDNLHLTSAGYAVIGRQAVSQIEANAPTAEAR